MDARLLPGIPALLAAVTAGAVTLAPNGASRAPAAEGPVPAAVGSQSRAESQPRAEVRFEFEGNEAVSSGEMEKALRDIREDLSRHEVDAGGLEDAAYELARHLEGRGYRHCEVTAERVTDVRGSVEEAAAVRAAPGGVAAEPGTPEQTAQGGGCSSDSA